ncbi:MAG: hypothetical protein ACK4RN_17660 [Pseudorhodobacter sp.]
MAYVPRSKPNFAGDLQHDFRDFQYERRAETLSLLIGEVTGIYLRACTVLGMEDDPIADCLRADDHFDLRAFQVVHDFLAAWWRKHHLGFAMNPDDSRPPPEGRKWIPLTSYRALLDCFHRRLLGEVAIWALHEPRIIRQFCLVQVKDGSPGGIMAEIDLFDSLRHRYPLPESPFPAHP